MTVLSFMSSFFLRARTQKLGPAIQEYGKCGPLASKITEQVVSIRRGPVQVVSLSFVF